MLLENRKLVFVRNSLTGEQLLFSGHLCPLIISKDILTKDAPSPEYPATMSFSLGVIPPTQRKNPILQILSSRLGGRPLADTPISDVPLHVCASRGWDATTARWRNPVHPNLDKDLQRVVDSVARVWELRMVDTSGDDLPVLNGNQRDKGKFPI
jgi:hypothetical protein